MNADENTGENGRILDDDDDFLDEVPPRRRSRTLAVAPPPVPTEEETFVDRIKSIASKNGIDRTKVKLYRHGAGNELEFCRDYSAAEFEDGDLSLIRDEWGAGKYQLRVVGPKGIAMRELISIAKPTSAPMAQHSELSEVVRMLAEGQQRILEAVSSRPDPTAQMQQTLTLMSSMREAMGLNAAPVQNNPSSMLGDIVSAIRQLREVSDEINPKAAPESDNPMAMLPGVLDLVKTAMQAQQQPVMPVAALPPAFTEPAPQPVAEQPAENPAQPVEEEEPMNILVLKIAFQRLINMAARNAPLEQAVDLLDFVPEDMIQHIENEKWFDLLLSVAPHAEMHREYLTKVRDQWLKEINEPLEDDGETDS